ncbi:N-acetylmuramoyl-L-alanine amidase, partial [Aquisalimonas sp.]|uniref:peptidoglycan recognition protein family protein n=1 Tax=Aquisalimonas sp. TaxID=1872621 RepID=UPI0025C4DBB1
MSNASIIRTAASRTRADLGVTVVELAGFAARGHGALTIRGTMWHDTVTGTNVSRTRLGTLLRDGYVGLRGPIATVGLDRDGTLILVAAGRAHHAGSGSPTRGITSGNAQTVGLEVANRGRGSGERWTGAQYDAAVAFTAHLADAAAGARRPAMLGHREWAPGRKVDPWAPNLGTGRERIVAYRRGAARNYLTVGDTGAEVRAWQRDLIAAGFDLPTYGADGSFGAETASASLAFLASVGMAAADPDAPRIGPATRAAMAAALATPSDPWEE